MKRKNFHFQDQNNQIRKVFLHESLFTAFVASTLTDQHLMIFYDIQPPDVNCASLLHEIIHNDTFAHFRTTPAIHYLNKSSLKQFDREESVELNENENNNTNTTSTGVVDANATDEAMDTTTFD